MTTIAIAIIIVIGLYIYRQIDNKKEEKKSLLALSTKEFVTKYNTRHGQIKGGTLCFYGHWFGKPNDNYHQIESVTFDEIKNSLTLVFNEKETLVIINPQGINEYHNKLTIGSADHISWKWFYYGKPQSNENQYFIEVMRQGNLLSGTSNADWYNPDFKDLQIEKPALLLT